MILTELPPAAGPAFGRTVLMIPAGTAIGADANGSDGWVQSKVPAAAPLTVGEIVELVPVERATDDAPDDAAVNEETEPVATRGSEVGGGLGIGVVGMAKVAA